MKKNNDIIKQPMKNINTMKIMKKFLFLKIFLLALYSPTIFAITCSTGSGGGSSSGLYSWAKVRGNGDANEFPARYDHSSVEFKDKIWVIGGLQLTGFSNNVWSSGDGKNWNEEADNPEFRARDQHSSVVFDDRTGEGEKMWIIGGRNSFGRYLNDVWNSTNGKTWTQVRANGDAGGFDNRGWHTSVVFNKKMWVIGGFVIATSGDVFRLNDVWSSTDGKTWIEETKDSSAKFSTRNGHETVVFDDDGGGEKMWVIGGNESNGNNKNDVWSSTDGKTWTLVKPNNSEGFSGRNGHTSVVFDDKMWVIGGSNGGEIKGDVWSSTNGVTWNEETASALFLNRYQHTSEVFDNKVLLIGGSNTSTTSSVNNDVWSMIKN
jgi:hypothetical protein